MFVLYFLCHFNPNIVIYSMLFGFLDLSTLYILQEANTPFSFNFISCKFKFFVSMRGQ